MAIGDLPTFQPSPTAGPPDPAPYVEALEADWQSVVQSDLFEVEANAQTYLERHPCLLPGSSGTSMRSGHAPWPGAVISQPQLPGLSELRPDFMWIATDSAFLVPVCIEIERPDKQWFTKSGTQHSHLTQARSQVEQWQAWFADPVNQQVFIRTFKVPPQLADRRLNPRYVIVHGRSSEFSHRRDLRDRRAVLSKGDTQIVPFDSLRPDSHALDWGTVRLSPEGTYKATNVPASFAWHDSAAAAAQSVDGWREAIQASPDLSAARKDNLISSLADLEKNPSPGLRFSVARRL